MNRHSLADAISSTWHVDNSVDIVEKMVQNRPQAVENVDNHVDNPENSGDKVSICVDKLWKRCE